MKKFLTLFIFIFSFVLVANAEVNKYKTTDFAYRYVNDYGNWTEWSDWQYSNLLITINFDADKIIVYTEEVQIYKILEYIEPIYDDNGVQVKFRMKDQDGDYGTLRLRVQYDGTSQIYIDFANIMWVYNVVKIN